MVADGAAVDPVRLEQALANAYAHLNRRERTVGEVRGHLEGRAVEQPVIDRALTMLIDEGHLDDGRFARLFAQDKRELQGWGPERIRRALLVRGVEPKLVEAALTEGEQTDLERAVELLRRRFPVPPRDRRERDRALGVLIRKGYGSELALDALAAHARRG